MTLQQPKPRQVNLPKKYHPILCHKCGAPIVFSKDHIGSTGRKIPLDPFFDNESHQQHCMYYTSPSEPDTDALFMDFLSMVPNRRPKRIIGAVGRAK